MKWTSNLVICLLIAALTAGHQSAMASDHLDGPVVLGDPATDITDMYVFPSPNQSGNLVVIMNVKPVAGENDHFRHGLHYILRLRRAAPGKDGVKTFQVNDTEYRFDCSFDEPRGSDAPVKQKGECVGPNGEAARVKINDEGGAGTNGFRAFAGLRSDPFFMDVEAALKTKKLGKLSFVDPSRNTLLGTNVLSIVIDFNVAKLIEDAAEFPLIAVTGEVSAHGYRLDAFGRPEITNVTLSAEQYDPVNRDLEIRDLFNREDAFAIGETYAGAYRARLNANLRFWDSLDGKIDWPFENGNHPMTELLLADYMTVDPTKPFGEDTYFEIERSLIDGHKHETSGGRAPNDDFLDTLYTIYVTRGNEPISDGVDAPTKPAPTTFPYLAAPNPWPPAGRKAEPSAAGK
jgi:hypothetical protein